MDARTPDEAATHARAGLAAHAGDDTEGAVLLLREIFKAHLAMKRHRSAHAVARKMVTLGVLSEITHADLGRACAALGWWLPAAHAYRLAARFAPARRRALHWGACASAFQHAEAYPESLAALDRAIRWSSGTRPLHRAHATLVRIDRGEQIDDVAAVVAELECARCGEGYGRYVLGCLAMASGRKTDGRRWLREFVRRNAADPLKSATLAGEIRRARSLLGPARRG